VNNLKLTKFTKTFQKMSFQSEDFNENHMNSLIETSFSLNTLDKKFLKKASFIAMKTIMTNVINLTLQASEKTFDSDTIQKKVFEICAERGIVPQKDKGILTGYALFCKQQREENKEQYSGKSLGEVSKELSQLWKKLSEEDKDEYKINAKKTPPSDKKKKSELSKTSKKGKNSKKRKRKSKKSNDSDDE